MNDQKPSHQQPAEAAKHTRRAVRLVEIKAGAFVVLLLVLGLGTITILGEKRHVFEREMVLHAAFEQIQGLREGAPVRIAGVNVGSVARVDFVNREGKPLVEVTLKVSRDAAAHIRSDSIARIDGQGLLGDKLIEISAGTPSEPALAAGASLKTSAPADFDKMLRQAADTLDRAKTIADKLAKTIDAIADPQMVSDLHASMSSLRHLMAATEKGEGMAHALFYDKHTTQQFAVLTAHVDQLVAHVDSGVADIDRILGSTDENGRQLVNNLSSAAKNVSVTLDDVHRSQVLSNLSRASSDLAYLTAYTKAGKGTIGGALIDPVAYEQIVTILGGVNRSRTLRALVRYAISQDDGKTTPRLVDSKH